MAGRTEKRIVFDELAAIAKAVGSGRRLELVELLAQGEHSVEVLSRTTGMGVTLVSAHLQTLKRAGVAAARREGRTVYYRLTGSDVAELFVALKRVGLAHSPGLRSAVETYRAAGTLDVHTETIHPSAVTSEMTVVDVRPTPEYGAGHFPGAVSIPLAELEHRYVELDPSRPVVVYCRGEFCRMARDAAQWLTGRGYAAAAMGEGVIEWRADGTMHLDATA